MTREAGRKPGDGTEDFTWWNSPPSYFLMLEAAVNSNVVRWKQAASLTWACQLSGIRATEKEG